MKPAAPDSSILDVATELGLQLVGRSAHCFNAAGHSGGSDNRPSLTFYPQFDRFKCFACGVRGDAIALVMAVQKVGYREATAWLRSRSGSVAGGNTSAIGNPARHVVSPDHLASEVYSAMYENSYWISPETPAGQYLCSRGLNVDIANQHRAIEIGDPEQLYNELVSMFGLDRLKAAGLVGQQSDHFLFARHHLLFLYFDGGRPVYVQARDVTGQAHCKELSLAGRRCPAPFNADVLQQEHERVLICEGCIDTLSAIQLGHPAVGVPGVTGFQDEWFDRFDKTRHVTIVFDNDDAGRRHGAELRSQFRIRGHRADAYFPSGVNDLNELLQQLNGITK